ncbi:MAG TPA: L-threonylcarbamoyladenylate synthase, partial [Vicinamibacterales bacterium]|nr:L-threonylcarbamoyladenylate synthase [Vicinamibacterales bacterium]
MDASAPDRALIGRAAESIRRGGVVAMPTDTLYGLAADPFSAEAVAKVFRAKGRASDQALPLVGADVEQIAARLGALSKNALLLADRFWPGPLTILVKAPLGLAPAVSAGTRRVGVRVPAHEVTRALCVAADSLLTATSANRSGEPPTD